MNVKLDFVVLRLGKDIVEVEDDVTDGAVGGRDIAVVAVSHEVVDNQLVVHMLSTRHVSL
jgi:hypothetical protein